MGANSMASMVGFGRAMSKCSENTFRKNLDPKELKYIQCTQVGKGLSGK